MILRALGLDPVRDDVTVHYPELAPLRAAAQAGDWGGVAGYFAGRPAGEDTSAAAWLVSETAGAEQWLLTAADTDRDSALARTLLGGRFVTMGWNARTALQAKYVTVGQFDVFFRYLGRAEKLLEQATAMDPTDVAAWTFRLTAARGLQLPLAESRRRYERVAEICRTPHGAQQQMLQSLCAKWYGSVEQMHAFADQVAAESPAGSLGPALVAVAHVEHALESLGKVRDFLAYLDQTLVRDSLVAAAQRSVLHPDFQRVQGWVRAQSTFAFAHFAGRHYIAGKPHMKALGEFAHAYGWEFLSPDDWPKLVRLARRAMR